MLEIGSVNQLDVVKIVDFGVYLDGGERGEILLPSSQVPSDCVLGSRVDAFLYFDSDDLLIATTQTPRVQVGCCAYMTVVDVNAVGAFLDWGLAKDLLVPFNEQQTPMRVGRELCGVCLPRSAVRPHRRLLQTQPSPQRTGGMAQATPSCATADCCAHRLGV